MILVYTTCANKKQAKEIGKELLKKRLASCALAIPGAESMFFWPPGKNKIEESREAILLLKTFEKNFSKIEKEIKKLHSYEVPCISALPVLRANKEYLKWLKKEV